MYSFKVFVTGHVYAKPLIITNSKNIDLKFNISSFKITCLKKKREESF